MATWDLFHLEDECSEFTPFFTDQMENRDKDGLWELTVLAT